MKTLDEHNKSILAMQNIYPKNNGIACPVCGKELQDTDGNILTSFPPRTAVNCSNCEYKGFRY